MERALSRLNIACFSWPLAMISFTLVFNKYAQYTLFLAIGLVLLTLLLSKECKFAAAGFILGSVACAGGYLLMAFDSDAFSSIAPRIAGFGQGLMLAALLMAAHGKWSPEAAYSALFGILVSSVVAFVASFFADPITGLFAVFLIGGEICLGLVALSSFNRDAYVPAAKPEARQLSSWAMTLLPFLLVFLALGFGKELPSFTTIDVLTNSFSRFVHLGHILLCLIIVAVFVVSKRAFLSYVPIALYVLLVLGFSATLLSTAIAPNLLASLTTVFFYYFAWVKMFETSNDTGGGWWAVAAGLAACFLASHLGTYLSNAFTFLDSIGSVGIAFLSTVLVFGSIVVTFVLDGGRKKGDEQPPAIQSEQESLYGSFHTKANELAKETGMTERELEIMLLFARGRSRKSIAELLAISENTVGGHIRRVYEKAGVHSRQELLNLIEGK